jgi:hypothetical protein
VGVTVRDHRLRAKLRSVWSKRMANSEEEAYFEKNKAAFELAFKAAVELSSSLAGQKTDLRRGWSTWIFARLCATGNSMRRLLHPFVSGRGVTIDHGSIVTLARNVMEAGVLISYISEKDILEEEWKCRLLVFNIHDCVARVRLFKGISAVDLVDKWSASLEDLRRQISSNAYFKKLLLETQEKAKAGSLIYIDGLRSAAKVAGWDKSHFDAMYNYFSLQSHSAPVSFYWMEERQIDYKTIAPYQYYLVGLALEMVSNSTNAASKRMREIFPNEAVKLSE